MACFLFNIAAVCGNDLLVPVKGFFLGAFEGSVALIVTVYVDEAVAFLHFARAG